MREREREKSARSTPGHSGHFWSPQALALGPAPVASPSASATALINWFPIVPGETRKLFNGEGLGRAARRINRIAWPRLCTTPAAVTFLHHHHHHRPPLSSQSPISENAKKMKGQQERREKKLQSTRASRQESPPSHHVNHSDQSLGPCRPPSLGIHTLQHLDRTLRCWPHDLRCTAFSFQLRPRIWTQSKYPSLRVDCLLTGALLPVCPAAPSVT